MKKEISLNQSILITLLFVFFLWFIKLIEEIFSRDLTALGIYPREIIGLIGVIFAPLVHGSFSHLIHNSFPLVLLGVALLYGYPISRWWTLLIIWFVSGVGVWLFARQVFHIGASGITHGLFFYLFIMSVLRRDRQSIALMLIAFFLYGSMVLTIFPYKPGVSFEYHFFGALGGVISAVIFYRIEPVPKEKNYSWEEESEEEDLIGDEWRLDTTEIEKEQNKDDKTL